VRWYEEFLFTAAAVYYVKCANMTGMIVSIISHVQQTTTTVRLRQKTVNECSKFYKHYI